MRIDLSGKTVLVTGGSRGIGTAIARAFAGAGARVAVHYGRERERAEALAAEVGGGGEAFGADLRDPAACEALWEAVVSRFGGVDVLVNNAGVAISAPLEDETAAWTDAWDATMAVNVRAVGLLSRAAIRHFQQRG